MKTHFSWQMGAKLMLLLVALVASIINLIDGSAGLMMATAGAAVFTDDEKSGLMAALKELKGKLVASAEDIAKIVGIEKLLKTSDETQKKQADEIAQLKKEAGERDVELLKLKKIFAKGGGISPGQRRKGFLSDEAAKAFAAANILGLARKGAFGELDDAVFTACKSVFGIEAKTAISTTDIGLPVEYTQELKELVSEYGVARRVMSYYPIGRGSSKPARLGTQDDFTFPILMSAAFTEKNVKLGNASLESHKGGGIIRIPREIDEQGIIPLGQMLARYAARKFGKIEDTIGFLGDGTAGYDSISGVCKIASVNSNVYQLGATKTAPSDATIEDWRSMRPLCATPILSSGCYYAHPTWERKFRTYKTQADPFIYVQNGPGGMATLDGYPIIWTEIMAPYSTNANAGAYIGVFGDLSYWWFGEHGSPRTDFSTDVFFTTDELAVRWLEEIDFDYADPDAAAALQLAAA